MTIDLDGELRGAGPSRRLTSMATDMSGLAWTRDGRSLVFGSGAAPYVVQLWRVTTDNLRPPERLEVAGPGARRPAIAASRNRLVFERRTIDPDIYRFGPTVLRAPRSCPPSPTSTHRSLPTALASSTPPHDQGAAPTSGWPLPTGPRHSRSRTGWVVFTPPRTGRRTVARSHSPHAERTASRISGPSTPTVAIEDRSPRVQARSGTRAGPETARGSISPRTRALVETSGASPPLVGETCRSHVGAATWDSSQRTAEASCTSRDRTGAEHLS